MLSFLDGISLQSLAVFALLLAMAPFHPEPHLLEKLRMLREGTLVRPIDIFDLVMHSTPIILLILKLIRLYMLKS